MTSFARAWSTARHPCEPDVRDEVRREGWRHRLSRREENRGLNVMFIMMNAARLAVGVQGVAVAERATQRAVAYANERRQGRTVSSRAGEMGPIIEHADIRRTLMTMKALTQAVRAICLVTARETDVARRSKDPAQRAAAAQRVALLTPIAKAFSTDIGCEVASLGVQVHGGMGFIEETGAAQYYRDARILPIYEGTNGIQAMDLVARKLPLEGGRWSPLHCRPQQDRRGGARLQRTEFDDGRPRREAVAALGEASRWMGANLQSNPDAAMAGATPYLRLFGLASGGIYLAKSALAAARNGGQTDRSRLRGSLRRTSPARRPASRRRWLRAAIPC